MEWTFYESVNTEQPSILDFSDKDPLSNISFLLYIQPDIDSNDNKSKNKQPSPWFKPQAYSKLKEYRKLPVTYHPKNNTANSIMNYLIDNYGFTDVAARAFAGLVYRENRFNINAVNEDEKK